MQPDQNAAIFARMRPLSGVHTLLQLRSRMRQYLSKNKNKVWLPYRGRIGRIPVGPHSGYSHTDQQKDNVDIQHLTSTCKKMNELLHLLLHRNNKSLNSSVPMILYIIFININKTFNDSFLKLNKQFKQHQKQNLQQQDFCCKILW